MCRNVYAMLEQWDLGVRGYERVIISYFADNLR